MAKASARRSFHGPLQSPPPVRRGLPVATAARPLELVPASPSESSLGRAVLRAARAEAPTISERERILAGVLAALQGLTSANR